MKVGTQRARTRAACAPRSAKTEVNLIHKTVRKQCPFYLAVVILVISMPASTQTTTSALIPSYPPQGPAVKLTLPNSPGAEIDEFVGPFASWTNVKTAYGAVGDGVVDDTDALQRGLDKLSSEGPVKTLFFPSGVYRITKTLRLHNTIYVSVIGEDPDNTIIRWTGPGRGVMIHIDAVAYSRFNRLTWDGQNQAEVAVDQAKSNSLPHFDTGNEYAEDIFKDVGYGIRAGNLNIGAAETSVVRSRFIRNSKAGIITRNFNALDWWVWYSYFEDCGVGVTNDPGAGNFNVYNSVFKRSRLADIRIENTSFYSIRNNYSINSKVFYLSKGAGQNGALTVIQGNTILDTEDDAAIQIRDFGPVSMYDNVIRSRKGAIGPAIVHSTFGAVDTLTVGNTFTVDDPIRATGRWITDDNKTVPRSHINPAEPVIPFKYVSKNRRVFDVPAGADVSVVQQAIKNAGKLCGKRPIVHLPAADYRFNRTLVAPANCDVQIVGDGGFTTLGWNGQGGGPVITLQGPSKSTLRDLKVSGERRGDGIVIENADQPGSRVYMQGTIVNVASQNGLIVDGLDYTRVDLRSFTHQMINGSSVKVIGGPSVASGVNLGGRTTLIAGASANNHLSYEVTQGGRLVVKDFWYETGELPGYIKLTGDSAVTFEQARVYTRTNTSTPSVDIQDYKGRATLIGLDLEDKVRISGQGNGSVLMIGMMGRQANYFLDGPGAKASLLISRRYVSDFGSAAVNNKGTYDVKFLRDMLAQTRSGKLTNEYEEIPQGSTNARMYRVYAEQTVVGFHIKR